MAITVLKQTETSAVVKATSGGTIALATTLLSSTMTVTGTPTVNINGITWWVSPGSSDVVVVTRNSVELFRLYQNGQFDFAGNGWADNVENTSDIVISITGTGGCYLSLRKVAGYSSKIEPWTYGPYDDEGAVGS